MRFESTVSDTDTDTEPNINMINSVNCVKAHENQQVDVKKVSVDEPVTGLLKGIPTWREWQEMWALWDQ